MTNSLREGNNGLTYLDYGSLLQTIIKVLENPASNNLFTLVDNFI